MTQENPSSSIPQSTRQENAPQWFAIKVSHKEQQALALLEGAGFKTFCPMVPTDTTIHGKKVIVDRPLIPNTIFTYAMFSTLNSVKNAHPFITYCYKKMDGKYKILHVPTREMEQFIETTERMKDDITYFQPEDIELKKGDRVRIIGGVFDGYEGTLLKAKGKAKRMFLINFELLGALGTHIEPQYIQFIKK